MTVTLPAVDGVDSLVTAPDAANHARVSVKTIRGWCNRGYLGRDGLRVKLEPVGLDRRGRKLFSLIDIAKAEAATRSRAGRIHW